MAGPLRHPRAHDYRYLIRRWRKVATRCGLAFRELGEAGGYPIYFLHSRKADVTFPSVYFSAGIHGDEVGSTEGLLAWAEENEETIRRLNLLIFPCLNPWGLTNNIRCDRDGVDLNRAFRDTSIPQITAQMALFARHSFDLALMLHEDYDAQGCYMYEIRTSKPYWGELMLKAASRHIPADPRRKIEGRSARDGVIRPVVSMDAMPDWPEAFVLYFQKTVRLFTVETPSEFSLDDRVEAQKAIITKAVQLCRKEFASRRRAKKA